MFNISEDALEINARFFEVLDFLKRDKQISGIYGFAQKYNVVLGNLYDIKNHKSGSVKTEYLMYLVRDFEISAHWLLTGEGTMFRQTPARTE